MVAPSAFALPSSGGTVSPTGGADLSYVNGTWVAVSFGTSGAQPVVRYATDPAGTWSTATALPTAPTGYENGRIQLGPVVYADGNYCVAIRYQKVGALAFDSYRYRIYYASSLSGSWTEVDPGYNDYCYWQYFGYLNGQFVLSGMDLFTYSTSDPWPWIIATANTVGGAWTLTTGSTSGLSGTTQDRIPYMQYANGTYYRILERGPGNPAGGSNPFDAWVQTATSITGTWTSSTALPHDFTIGNLLVNGDIVAVSLSNGTLAYTDDLTGSWSTATLPSGMTQPVSVAYGASYYVVIGDNVSSVALVGYSSSLSTPFSSATKSLFSGGYRAAYGANYFVVSDGSGRLNYSYASAPTTGPTFLRLHQSPVMTPSRVRGIDLRQSQTPRITR